MRGRAACNPRRISRRIEWTWSSIALQALLLETRPLIRNVKCVDSEMKIEKQKLPKGFSYALKTSMIERAFQENNITINTNLIYSFSEIFFDAHFWIPNKNVDYYRFYIRAGHVQSGRRKEAMMFMQKTVIPEFIEWAKELVSLPENSTKLSDSLYFRRDFT